MDRTRIQAMARASRIDGTSATNIIFVCSVYIGRTDGRHTFIQKKYIYWVGIGGRVVSFLTCFDSKLLNMNVVYNWATIY